MEAKEKELLFVGFNQDNQCFSVGINDGFKFYNTEPFKMIFERMLEKEIAIVVILYRTKILVLVSSDNNMNHKKVK